MNSSNIYYPISGLINAVTSIILGILVLAKDRCNIVYKTYALFCLSIAIWSGFYFAWLSTDNITLALFYSRGFMAGAIFIPIFYLHHVCSLLNQIDKQKKVIIASYMFGILSLACDFTSYYIPNVIPRLSFKFWPSVGPIFSIFLVTWGSIVIYGAYLILIAYKKAYGIEKNRLRYMLIATVVGWGGGATNYPLWYGVSIPPFLNILVSAYVIIVAYAIVRHQLMDIDVFVKKTLVFAGLLAAVFAMLVLPTLIIQEYLLRTASTSGKLVGLAISGIVIIFTMRRIENFLTNVTDKYLFQKKYDYKELLKTFTTEVLTVLELDKLVNLTIDKLTNIVKMKSAAVLLFDDEKQQFNVMASQGIKDSSVTLVRPDGIVTFMDETHGYVLVSELRGKNVSIPDSIQEIIDKLNAELIIPMVLHEEVIGVLSLGKKKSDENYTQDDLDILLPLAKTLAIAISNAELFIELGKTQAEAAQREKMAVIGTLSAGINHEICNPLGIARGQCEAFLLNLKDGLYKSKTSEELIEKAKDIMAKVIKETDRATAITKKLSGFAKPSKGEAEIVHIDKELDEVFGLVGYELKLEKIEFHKNIQKDVPDLFVDKKQFQEILFNLMRNAGQAIGEKGRITITAKEETGNVFIDVQDTGSGIPEDKIKQLFNPFFTTKDPGIGTGLGLFIVRQVVEKNGGRIYLKETKVGEGTTFRLEFPAASREGSRVSK